MRFHLETMGKQQTASYVARHMKAVKAPREIFTSTALSMIHEYVDGIARKVNKVASTCLMTAAVRKETLVDDHLVREVLESEFEI